LKITLLLAFFSLIFLSGCVNKRGISHRYYNSCHEYYDLQGYYHKDCDKNIVDFKPKEPKSDGDGKKIW
jgi:hypothetical protein